jgi:chemotaxis protein CheD
MNKIEYVMTGEVKVANAVDRVNLVSSALGSCIAVCVYDAEQKIGGMAHMMMPGML